MRTSLVVALLAVGFASLSFAGQGDPSGGPDHVLKVFDNQGKVVGVFTSSITSAGVVVNVRGVDTFVQISHPYNASGQFSSSQYTWTGDGALYGAPNCSGPALIVGGDAPLFLLLRPSTVVRQGANAILYISADAPTTTVTIQSANLGTGCENYGTGPSSPPVGPTNVWTSVTSYSLTQNYPEPLTVHY